MNIPVGLSKAEAQRVCALVAEDALLRKVDKDHIPRTVLNVSEGIARLRGISPDCLASVDLQALLAAREPEAAILGRAMAQFHFRDVRHVDLIGLGLRPFRFTDDYYAFLARVWHESAKVVRARSAAAQAPSGASDQAVA